MSSRTGFEKVLEVLDARVRMLEVMLSREQTQKAALRSRQVEITRQEQDLARSLQEVAAAEPTSFRYRELRLRKLIEDQRRLQPTLAKAAIQREAIKGALKTVIQQRMGVALQAEKDADRNPVFQSEDDHAQILFELSKRR